MSEHRIPRLDASASDEQIRRHLEREGCVILEEVIDHETIDRMLGELRPYMERKPTGNGDFSGYHTKRLHSLFTKSSVLPEFILHPNVKQAVDIALLHYCDNYQLNSNSITAIGPAETVQPLHRDDLLYPLSHPSERNAAAPRSGRSRTSPKRTGPPVSFPAVTTGMTSACPKSRRRCRR